MAEKVFKGRRAMLPEEVELPVYVCHKRVRAAVIVALSYLPGEGDYRLSLAGGNYVDVSKLWVSKHTPQPGGVYVQYEDGYSSYSPIEAFEAGYSPEEQAVETAAAPAGPNDAEVKAMVARIEELGTALGARNGELLVAEGKIAQLEAAAAAAATAPIAHDGEPSAEDLDKAAAEKAAADATEGHTEVEEK